jgi:hypothetical protein
MTNISIQWWRISMCSLEQVHGHLLTLMGETWVDVDGDVSRYMVGRVWSVRGFTEPFQDIYCTRLCTSAHKSGLLSDI